MRLRNDFSGSAGRSAGFTLIEVLIAVVIFGIGLLAMASLQGVARKASYEAVQRTTAAHLAESLLERMRANPVGLEHYLGNSATRIFSEAAAPATAAACTGGCTPQEMAAADLDDWWSQVVGATETVVTDGATRNTGGLLSPTVCLAGESDGASGIYEVAIAWRGVTEVAVPPAHPCGQSAIAGDPEEAFRRVVVIQTFLNTL